jgi:ribosomal protein L24
VFTLKYLPGRIFVFAPAKTIEAVATLVGLPKPWQVPRSEWVTKGSSPLFLPWTRQRVNVRSWVRICQKGSSYCGDLGYVVGSSGTTDGLFVAVVPRIHHIPRQEGLDKKKGKGKGKRPVRRGDTLALFDPDVMEARFGSDVVKAFGVDDKEDFVSIFEDKKINHAPLNVVGFDWADLPIFPGHYVYLFDRQLFYHGLLLMPIFAFATVDVVAIPTSYEITPFVQSSIDPACIDRLVSQLHWRAGDRVSCGDEIYVLEDVQLDNGSVLASPHQYHTTEKLHLVQIPINELQRKFFVGDDVVVLEGVFKGMTGSVLNEEDGTLNILTKDDGTYVSIFIKYTSLADTFWQVSVKSQWVASRVTPPHAIIGPSDHLVFGDLLRVVDGPYRGQQGQLEQKLNMGATLSLRDIKTKKHLSVCQT